MADPRMFEENLNQLSLIESTWTLPKLPDLVKLDLAMQAPGPDGLRGLLYGLDADLQPKAQPEPEPVPTAAEQLGINVPQRSFTDELKVQWAGWNTNRPPQEPSLDAVRQFKMDAIKSGYLPADTPVDQTWNPAFNSARNAMLDQQMRDRYMGDRPGAVSMNTLQRVFTDWGSPSGLIRALVDFDFLPDVGAVKREFATWGDKFDKIGRSDGPLDFAKNLVDALTGPIDDIVVPVVNDILLFAGIGGLTTFVRGGATAVEAGRAMSALEQVYRFVPGARALAAGADAERMAEAGFLATRFGRSENAAVKLLGQQMAGWRELRSVGIAKKTVQTGMRLGLAARIEDTFLPGYQGGVDLEKLSPGLGEKALAISNNPLVWGVGEALFTPYAFIEPGTTGSLIRAVGRGAETAFTTAVGRPAGAVGRVVGDNKVGRALQALHFERAAGNSDLLEAFHRGYLSYLDNLPDGVEARKAYEQGVAQTGVKAQLRSVFGVENDEDLGKALSYVTLAAALDNASAQAAAKASKVEGTYGWFKAYFKHRSSLVAQLRGFGDPVANKTAIVAAEALNHGKTREDQMLWFAERIKVISDDELVNLATAHNQISQDTIKALFDESILNPDVIQRYMATVYDAQGNWTQFSQHTEEIGNLSDVLYQHATIAGAKGPRGGRLAVAPSTRNPGTPIDPFERLAQESGFADVFASNPDLNATFWQTLQAGSPDVTYMDWTTNKAFAPLARQIDPLGKFALTRVDRATKQEALSFHALVRYHLKLKNLLWSVRETAPEILGVLKAESGVDDVTAIPAEMARGILSGWATANPAKQPKALHMKALLEYMRSAGVSWDDLAKHVDTGLAELDQADDWHRFGLRLGATGSGDVTKSLQGKLKELKQRADFLASEVDAEKLLESVPEGPLREQVKHLIEGAGGDGYRLTYGVEFMMPQDILETPIFSDVTTAQLRRSNLGSWFSRKPQPALMDMQRRQVRVGIANELVRARNAGRDLTAGGTGMSEAALNDFMELGADGRWRVSNIWSAELDGIVGELYRHLEGQLSVAGADLAHSWQQGRMSRFVSNLNYAKAPKSIEDLSRGRLYDSTLAALDVTYGRDAANAVWRGLKQGRAKPFRDFGLYSLEANLRSRNQLVDGLRVLGGSSWRNADELTTKSSLVKRSLLGAGIGAAIGGAQGGAQGALGGAAGGALFGVSPAAGAGAIIGANVGAGEGELGGLAGAAVGAAAGFAAGRAGVALANRAETSVGKLQRYGYLADNLVNMRDFFRFSMSPFFDLSRYSEGMVLAHVGRMPETVLEDGSSFKAALRWNQSPTAWRKSRLRELHRAGVDKVMAREQVAQEWDQVLQAWRAASGGNFDPETLESSARWFHDVGIMGYNPTAWMSSTFADLMAQGRKAGLKDAALEKWARDSYEAVRNIYTYGTTNRSAAEMSVNFLLFPFSFQKKAISNIGRFLAEDWTRAVIFHDALKTYDILNERYNLSEKWRDKLPILDQFSRMNLLAYGLSPGRIGGINAPLIEAAGATLDPVLNLFLPQGYQISSADDAKTLQKVWRRSLPAINDIDTLLDNVKEQGHVAFDPSHTTRAAQARDAWAEWADYKREVNAKLREAGYSWNSMYTREMLAPVRQQVAAKRAELEQKYPGWAESRVRVAENAQRRDMELADRKYQGEYQDAQGVRWSDSVDVMVARMESDLASIRKQMRSAGLSLDDPEDVPPAVYDVVRRKAVNYAQNARPAVADEWRRVWQRFYQNQFGPITVDL